MANVNVTSNAWTEISITSGTIQNISATADIELSAEQTDNSGVVLKPSEIYQWDNETIYARAVTEDTGALRVVNFKKAAGGGGYVLPVASASELGGVKVGNNLSIDASGVLSANAGGYTLPPATASTLGGVIIGDNVTVDANGEISVAAPYSLPPATASTLGGVIAGDNITVDANGEISTHAPYSLPAATANDLGGVKIGSNVNVDANGVISVAAPYSLPTASANDLGGVKIGSNITIDANGAISAPAAYTLPTAAANTLGGVKVGTNLSIDANGVLSALGSDSTPIGTIISYMGTTAPANYLICDGTTYNIADYPLLSSFITTQFGSVDFFGGDGVTTFAVPDLQGEFLRGTGTNSHANQGSGSNVGTHQDGTQHMDIYYNANYIGVSLPSDSITSADKKDYAGGRTVYTSSSATVNSNTNSSYGLFTSRPTNTSVLYCIKYTNGNATLATDPVGRVVFDVILRTGYIKANGATVADASTSVPDLLQFVQDNSATLLAADAAAYAANVGLYLYDSGTDALTLPDYTGRFMQGGNSVESVAAGLPNIKGAVKAAVPFDTTAQADGSNCATSIGYDYSGSITNIETNRAAVLSRTGDTTASNFKRGISLDASLSSSIYSDSVTTVQPPAIKMIPQIKY